MDLQALKNDKERTAFLEDYRNKENGWILWKEFTDIRRRWWLRFMGDGIGFIVEEQEQEIDWPKKHLKWLAMQRYIIREPLDKKPLSNQQGSRTEQLNELKKLQKEGKL